MQYYIGESGSSGMKFDNLPEFLNAVREIAEMYKEDGEEWFEIEIVNG